MNRNDIIEIKIYINLFVHYPNAYSSNMITEKFNNHLIKEDLYLIYNPKCYVMVNSAPHSEEESIKIEISSLQKDILNNNEDIILDLKEFTQGYFNNQINNIEVDFVK